MKVERIDHFVLTVRDIEVSCEFYSRALGMDLVTFGDNRKALHFGGQKINLHQVGKGPEHVALHPAPGSGDFCLVTSVPLTDVINHLKSCGVSILAGPVRRAGAIGTMDSIYFRDPDGNLIEISNYGELSERPLK